MGDNRYRRIDSIMRSTHLYTGLFLAPWLLVYATSGFCLSHHQWIRAKLGITPPNWEVLREVDFVPGQGFPKEQTEQAAAILRAIDLEGAHNVLAGQSNARRLVILRISGGGNYRIVWHRDRKVVIVERQLPFSFYRLIHFLHFRHGFQQKQFAHLVWGVIVDAVTITMWLWVLSGLYIWFRVPRKRALGSLCVIGGSVLFIVLVILLCL